MSPLALITIAKTWKKEILPFGATWIKLEGIRQSEIYQRKTDMWNLKKKKNLIETKEKLLVARGKGGGWENG